MKNIFRILLATIIFSSGCKTIQLADFETGAPLQNKLPALEITNPVPQNPVPAVYGYYATGYPQNDAHSMFTKMVEQNITDPIGEKYGYVSYNLTVGNNKLGGWGYYMVSLFTLTAPNLFGMPFFVAKSSVE